ncbi:MAG: IPT/TIG domain-containing protein [Ardenticatenaceae bacterium]|nr:IPT/TIG domain-containing protein [Ardenticatenaceae bacterium]
MTTTTHMRLPGIYFLPAERPSAPTLPPLDVAAFVGFAQRGPLHAPVAVEDIDVYRAIFGGDLALARDAGRTIYACLPTAVSAFFANGGRRCYVVRVAADSATPTRLPLPGVISLGGAGAAPRLTPLYTSSPGAWGAQLRLGSRLVTTPLPAAVFTPAGSLALTWQTGSAPQAIQPGDVLRLAFGDAQFLFPVQSVSTPATALAQTPVILQAARLWPLVSAANLVSPPLIDAVARLTLDGSEPLAITANLLAQDGLLHLHLSGSDREKVSAGDVLWLQPSGMPGYLFPVTQLQTLGAWGSPPETTNLATAVSMLSLADNATLPGSSPLAQPDQVDRLRFELNLWEGESRRPTLPEMAFNAGHPRFWGSTILLDSSGLRANAPADPNGQQAAQASLYFQQMQAAERTAAPSVALQTIALAGLLAPSSAAESERIHLPLGMAAILHEEALAAPAEADVGDNGLASFAADYFLDPDLAGVGWRTLLDEAFAKYYVADRRLRGLHSLLYIDEVAQLALPDAIHRHWTAVQPTPVADAIDLPQPPPPDASTFAVCGLPPEITAVLPHSGHVRGGETIAILGARFDSGLPAVTVGGQPATAVQVISSTMVTAVTPASAITGPVPVTLSNSLGTAQLAEAFRYVRPTLAPLPTLPAAAAYAGQTLLTLQEALVNFCMARRDVVAIFSLPQHFEKRQCIEWQEGLRRQLGLPRRRVPSFDDVGTLADLSYTAVYHPWLFVRNGSSGSLRPIPPDGAVCGLIAAREQARGVWVAPANQPLQGVLSLNLPFAAADWADLFELQFNLIRREARDFRVMSAHTLSDDRLLLQLSVRRLLILLRKTAVERGMDFVFENNDQRLWENGRLLLETMLQELFYQGAFAGATTQEAYRVNTGPRINTRQRIDQGQFYAEIQVAPSQPLEFITVLLTRTSEGALRATETTNS